MNVFLEISNDGTLQLRRRHGNDVKSLKKEWQSFAHVTDDKLQLEIPPVGLIVRVGQRKVVKLK